MVQATVWRELISSVSLSSLTSTICQNIERPKLGTGRWQLPCISISSQVLALRTQKFHGWWNSSELSFSRIERMKSSAWPWRTAEEKTVGNRPRLQPQLSCMSFLPHLTHPQNLRRNDCLPWSVKCDPVYLLLTPLLNSEVSSRDQVWVRAEDS